MVIDKPKMTKITLHCWALIFFFAATAIHPLLADPKGRSMPRKAEPAPKVQETRREPTPSAVPRQSNSPRSELRREQPSQSKSELRTRDVASQKNREAAVTNSRAEIRRVDAIGRTSAEKKIETQQSKAELRNSDPFRSQNARRESVRASETTSPRAEIRRVERASPQEQRQDTFRNTSKAELRNQSAPKGAGLKELGPKAEASNSRTARNNEVSLEKRRATEANVAREKAAIDRVNIANANKSNEGRNSAARREIDRIEMARSSKDVAKSDRTVEKAQEFSGRKDNIQKDRGPPGTGGRELSNRTGTETTISGVKPELTSRAARREAMRRENIPTSQQPKSQFKNESGWEYRYELKGEQGAPLTKSVQDQKMDRPHLESPHWEAGRVKLEKDTGEIRFNQYGRPKLEKKKSKVEYYER